MYGFPIKLHLFTIAICFFYLQNYVMLQFLSGRILQVDSSAFEVHSWWTFLYFQSILFSALTLNYVYDFRSAVLFSQQFIDVVPLSSHFQYCRSILLVSFSSPPPPPQKQPVLETWSLRMSTGIPLNKSSPSPN